MRWFILFFLILALLLCWTGVIQVNLPPCLAVLQPLVSKSSGTTGHFLQPWFTSTAFTSGSGTAPDAGSGSNPSTASGSAASTETRNYRIQTCTVDVPLYWAVQGYSAYSLQLVTSGKSLVLKIMDNFGPVNFDSPAFAAQMHSQGASLGYRFDSESRASFQGFPSYSVLMTKEFNGATVYQHAVVFTAYGLNYMLILSMRDADPLGDSQFAAVFNSIKFDR